ncbi:ABC transporter ATP-binding protein [Clostridium sp. YIM B02551]|uniref:ABC transporter ATP-binding protein n=1 Tax=Clostridium sp. YIM B02551 TaxID=2910679 RepID=UPI001EEB5B89|nr:ABC transporter ATP-binding protein [Clostridium sp. YIM B02551]
MNVLKEFIRPYKKECIVGPIFKLIEAILELLLPAIMVLVIDNGIKSKDIDYVIKMGVLMLAMSILGFGSSLVCQHYAARASQGFGTNLREKLFLHILQLSSAEVDKLGKASLINRITNDINQLQIAVAMFIRLVIRAPFICIGAIFMSMLLDFKLSLILIVSTPIFGIVIYFIINKTSPLYTIYQSKLDKLGRTISDNLTGIRVIRAFAKVDLEKVKFDDANDELTNTIIKVGRISILLNPLTTFGMNIAVIIILWIGGIRINAGDITQGEIIAFVNYIMQVLLALIVVSNLVIIFTKANSSAKRVIEVINTTPSITSENIEEVIENSESPVVEFEDVSFRYSEAGNLALKNITLNINQGETIGIIGGTGSGKSTFVNLIARLYDASNGEIRIDGKNIKKYNLKELREKVVFVPQKSVLFSGSILTNIQLGNKKAAIEDIKRSSRIAQIEEFIDNLPEGYNSEVNMEGRNFSGGQKQRLSIARAMARNSKILVLDDSSSALDFLTDYTLRKSIKEEKKDVTLIVISQRISSVKNSDRIIVFDNGEIVGVDTHKNLLMNCNVYKEIYSSQHLAKGEKI